MLAAAARVLLRHLAALVLLQLQGRLLVLLVLLARGLRLWPVVAPLLLQPLHVLLLSLFHWLLSQVVAAPLDLQQLGPLRLVLPPQQLVVVVVPLHRLEGLHFRPRRW